MRQVGILAVLLVLSLTATYVTWNGEDTDEDRDTKVMVYRASVDDLQQIRWSEDTTTTLVARKKDSEPYVWVTITEKVEVAPEPEDDGEDTGMIGPTPDEGGEEPDDEPSDEPVFEERVVSFKGNEAADKLWESFAPLYALRELEPGPDASDEAFGFDAPTATIEVVRGSGPLTLTVGGETYGTKDRYIRLDSRILLIDDKVLRPLQFAKTRLVDRLLHPITEAEAETVQVSASGRTASWVHKNKDDRAAAFWADASEPTVEDVQAATWLGKLLRMRTQNYVGPDDVPADLAPVFTYSVTGGGKSWSVEVMHATETDDYYAKGSYTRALVLLTQSLAAEAVADLESVLPQ